VTSEADREAARIREAYARRARLSLDSRYDYWQPANLFIYQSRERAFLAMLSSARFLPLAGRQVLDVGCGDGGVLQDVLRYGARVEDLHGVDLLRERVECAMEDLPGSDIRLADAQSLPYEAATFDLVLGFTLLSSVTDQDARHRICDEMARVSKPDALVVLYDFWTNPLNRDTRPLRRVDVQRLFPGQPIEFRGTTLAPPLVRATVRLPGGWLACSALEMLPFLRTHFLAAIRF
jgi:ubiquinone/menaquinone biosynthesis C-methylase UbiE